MLPFTRSQIERLGVRLLAGQPAPAEEDRAMLRELLRAYDAILDDAVARVREQIGVAPTSRIKNSGTIVEKLERHGGSWLKSLQDIAGMRIVGDFDRAGQDALVARLVDLFADGDRAPIIVEEIVVVMLSAARLIDAVETAEIAHVDLGRIPSLVDEQLPHINRLLDML